MTIESKEIIDWADVGGAPPPPEPKPQSFQIVRRYGGRVAATTVAILAGYGAVSLAIDNSEHLPGGAKVVVYSTDDPNHETAESRDNNAQVDRQNNLLAQVLGVKPNVVEGADLQQPELLPAWNSEVTIDKVKQRLIDSTLALNVKEKGSGGR